LKDDLSQFFPVDGTVLAKHFAAKGRNNVLPSLLAWLYDFPRELVGINNLRPEFAQHGGRSAFAGSDSAG
jgi:hypothetical protein